MKTLNQLLANNRTWAASISAENPDFFSSLSRQQSPKYLWIGCSDSRVPANQIVGLVPGEMFVHRNVGNVVASDDLNCLSALQFAVDVLKVRHIIVCGHYGCGGIRAVLGQERLGLVDKWLTHIRQVHQKHADKLVAEVYCADRLCELNVIEQTLNVCQTLTVQDAWKRRQPLVITGWIYAVKNGLLRDLGVTVTSGSQLETAYESALLALRWNGWFHSRNGAKEKAASR